MKVFAYNFCRYSHNAIFMFNIFGYNYIWRIWQRGRFACYTRKSTATRQVKATIIENFGAIRICPLFFSTNLLIANLATADLLFLTFCVPLTAYSYLYGWNFSESLCFFVRIKQKIFGLSTILLLFSDDYAAVYDLLCQRLDGKILFIVYTHK